jgi:hypothetical protein
VAVGEGVGVGEHAASSKARGKLAMSRRMGGSWWRGSSSLAPARSRVINFS